MAVTITVAELAEANRVGSTTRETSEVTRLRDYSIAVISQHLGTTYDDTPDVVVNLAAAQLVGYLYDKPTVSGGVSLANAFKFSGAGQALFPYRIHHVGLVGGDLVRAAQASVGTEGNPVTDVGIMGAELVVEFADGSTETHDLPAVGVDNAAVRALIDAHAAMPEIHHVAGGNVPGDTVLGNAAGGRLPGPAVAMRMGWTLDTTVADADTFLRSDNHPDDGATVGTTAGLLTPPIPPVLGQAEGYRFHIWIAGAVAPVALIDAYGDQWLGEFMTPVALTISGVAGAVYSEMHSRSNTDGLYSFSAVLPGSLIATQTWVTAQIANIMLSGGGITAAQAQTLIDAAIGDFQTAAEVQAVVTAAIAALPEYQTLAEVNALITAAVGALSLGQTAAEVQALITLHAAMPNIHHAPGGGGSGVTKTGTYAASTGAAANTWVSTALTPSATATLVGIQFIDGNHAAGGLTDVDDWVIAWLDAGRLRGGKTARINTRPSNQTRVYAIRISGGAVQFRGNAIGAGEGLKIQVWEQ